MSDSRDQAPSTRRTSTEKGRARLRDQTTIDRYVVLDRVGAGGMGEVFRAYDPMLGRVVAIKRVRSQAGDRSVEESQRLRREAQAIAQLSHPNVIAVHDVGTHEGQLFMAMELVEGLPLGRWLAQRNPSRAAVLGVFLQAARGLAAAHDAGIVHRDFKPSNVLVGDDGRVRVLDFGLARRVTSRPPRGSEAGPELLASALEEAVTRPGDAAGTPRYMAPEQFLLRAVDGRADQFAFAVALYEAVVGKRPFAGETPVEVARAAIRGEIEPVPDEAGLPAWLVRLMRRGLSFKPIDRFASMHEVIEELSRDRHSERVAHKGGADAPDLFAAFPPPEHGDTKERVARLRRELEEVEALKRRGDFAAAADRCRALSEQAADLEYLPLVAACLYALGSLQHKTGDPASAEATLYRAADLAARVGDDWQVANSLVALVPVLGDGLGRFQEAGVAARLADVAVTRAGGNASLRSRLYIGWGRCLRSEGRLAEAVRAFELALSFDEESHGSEHRFLSIGLCELADALLEIGNVEAATRTIGRALSIARRRSTGPLLATCLLVSARARAARGDARGAAEEAREAASIFERYPDRAHDRGEAMCEEALARLVAGEPGRGRELARAAVELLAGPAFDPISLAFGNLVLAAALRASDGDASDEAAALRASAARAFEDLGPGGGSRLAFFRARVERT